MVLARDAHAKTAAQPRSKKVPPGTPTVWGKKNSENIPKILADLTLPIAAITSDTTGRALIINNNFNNTARQPRLHLLEGRALDGDYKAQKPPSIRLPMDSAFVFAPNADLSGLPSYIHPANTPIVGP